MSNLTREIVFGAAALLCALMASVYDVRERKIPNRLTGLAIIAALGLHLLLAGWADLATSTLAGLIAGGSLLLFYLAGGMGAGDVKLMTAIGCFVGLHPVPTLLFMTALCGAALGLVIAFRKRALRQIVRNSLTLVQHHHAHGLKPHRDLNINNTATLHMPFAVPILAGCLITVGMQMWSIQA